jgi:hypothetical protein
MTEDNVFYLAAHRPPATAERAAAVEERNLSRRTDADRLLANLRRTKRLVKTDQEALVRNLGSLIDQFDSRNRRAVAKKILQNNEWEKRTRYIQFPNEVTSRFNRQAGSGGAFARIIENLVDVKVTANLDRDQVRSETIRKALRGTSFLTPSPFRVPEGTADADAALFAAYLSKVFEKLAEQTELADFLALVSKHRVFPTEAWYQWTNSLHIKLESDPNHLYKWGWDSDEDDFDEWIPWWAPKCVIGHLYIPFKCKRVNVPKHEVVEIKESLEVKDTRWSYDYWSMLGEFVDPEFMTESRIYHRLPVWLIALPLPDKIIPCLYVAIHLPGGFYPNQKYPFENDPVRPCFVGTIGEHLSGDGVYLPDSDNDDLNTLYVNISDAGITAIGTYVDRDIDNVKSDIVSVTTMRDIPEWLQEHPVQRFLQLTTDSDVAKLFALSPRMFCGRKWGGADDTLFRPAYPDDAALHITGLRQNTIAAYLLRNMVVVDDRTIFKALKDDALIKYRAAREVIDTGVSIFREAFDKQYDTK